MLPTIIIGALALAILWPFIRLGYELIKLAGRKDNAFTRAISAPGLWMQRITTKEPDDSMIECAIAALKPVIPEDVELLDFDFEHNQLYLDFSPEYKKMPKVYEVLCRAAIVRTLGQIDGVEYVDFQVNGEPLTDLEGKEIGLMNEDQFIENAGEEINAYKTADLTLYFSNKAGDKLVGQRVAMEYNSNISLEKLIVEQLIAGPPFEGAYPTIPSETKLLNISIKDNICYVNLDEGFLGTGYNVIESIPVYSIVNSLIENTDAQKVQISINGETNRMFRESINFDTIFEKNEGLIEQ